ncbi:MAG TPA: malto-oligosyltrehalose synthase [Alphaproteobacteria bacterium]|nr:malto-oligosyltrehalose synthase [Alphaproteobacteria bacterium]
MDDRGTAGLTQSPLHRLALLAGLERGHVDALGKQREISDDQLRMLLGALGLPARNDEEVQSSLRRCDEARWRRALEPVQVVLRTALPLRIPVTLEAERVRRLRWRLEEEAGGIHSGSTEWSMLPLVDERLLDDRRMERRRLDLELDLPEGYHRLILEEVGAELRLIVAPPRCYLSPSLDKAGEAWGFAIQLYSLRSRNDWGIGDFTTLAEFAETAAGLGAHLIGLSPLHALFPADPGKISPYSPSSRRRLNILYIDVAAVPELQDSPGAMDRVSDPDFQARLEELRSTELVDYRGVLRAKLEILDLIWAGFVERHLDRTDSAPGQAFAEFLKREGQGLREHALFEALAERFAASSEGAYWGHWPQAYRDPTAPEVARFAEEGRERVLFYAWLQWQADRQFGAVAAACRAAGMPIGLYADLAVGVDSGGAETWGDPELLVRGAHAGAPPDPWNMLGQDWGLPPWNPITLRERAYQPFIDLLRANMRYAAALRLDHIMALMRLYWVPAGDRADAGAYVGYPIDDLLALLALESRRNRCMVVGEALGTVPPGFAGRLEDMGVFSYRLLYFEREGNGEFSPPSAYPRASMVAVTTHDLATLPGYWRGRDLEIKDELNLFPDDSARRQAYEERARDRRLMIEAMEREGVLGASAASRAAASRDATPELIEAAYRFLGRARSRLLAVQLEDALGLLEQANMPGTVGEHPNWRRRLPIAVDELDQQPLLGRIAARLKQLRPWSPTASAGERPSLTPPVPEAVPRATYRLQLGRSLNFRRAAELIPYLDRLGVSHIYCSSYLKARTGSVHGYDIVDHNRLNPEIGAEAAFEEFVATMRRHGMGQLLDIIPNHMGIGRADNPWWLDILEWGRASPYAAFFDIDWERDKPELKGKVLVPLLGDQYGVALASGELALRFEPRDGSYSVWYHEHRFPICPRHYAGILQRRATQARQEGAAAEQALTALDAILLGLRNLPAIDISLRVGRRQRELGNAIKAQLVVLVRAQPELLPVLNQAAVELNGVPGEARSFNPLHRLLERQHYRLAYWRVSADEINYRRFFDIDDLAAIRTELPELFARTHRLVFRWLAEGKVAGFRIDHIDGLFDPAQYVERLQHRARQILGGEEGRQAIYVVVEKILAAHERLRDWPVAGTTGYDFLNLVNGLFVDGQGEVALDRLYRRFSGREHRFDQVLYDAKIQVTRAHLASELEVLARDLDRITEASWVSRDYTTNGLREALREIAAAFPVYRTYATPGAVQPEDRRDIDWAVAQAHGRSTAPDRGIFDFIQGVLRGKAATGAGHAYTRRELARFAMRFQQYTGPAMAKGLEDTAFYRYNRLLSLNEVGGDPRRFGVTPAAFHHLMAERTTRWPHTMLATATHDTKRGEDMRARLNLLSELPDIWRARVRRWAKLNQRRKVAVDGLPAPNANDEYHLYQTLLGSWPLELAWPDPVDETHLAAYRERIERYAVKALREAKETTSWAVPNEAYERAILDFIGRLLDCSRRNLFLDDFRPFAARIAALGMVNGLAQKSIALAAPGVPDIYQGTELWDFSLVDPDNRRPVDFALRQRLLDGLPGVDGPDAASEVRALYDDWQSGALKLHLVRRMLELRSRNELLFKEGAYRPLESGGTRAEALFAFARRRDEGGPALLLAVPRLAASLWPDEPPPTGQPLWGDTFLQLPPDMAREGINWLTGAPIHPTIRGSAPVFTASELFSTLPVAAILL